MPGRLTLAIAGAAAALSAGAPAAAADPELVASKRLSPRLEELTVRTSKLAFETHVRVVLPAGYRSHPGRRYPVLYLLHGASGDYRDWTRADAGQGDAERLTAGLPLIVVMPDGGRGGFYTDWFNNGQGGRPRWESWHIGELMPFVDRRYRTRAKRAGRAIAGLSMGGFGALSYAARHPDRFSAALSLSGAVDTSTPPEIGPGVIDSLSSLDGGPPGSLWGPRATEEVRWRGHNPWDLAENLRPLRVVLRTGNGQPGGPLGGSTSVDVIEAGVHAQAASLHQRLRRLGVAHLWDDYGAGHHTWPYWNRGLRQTLPLLMERFRRGPGAPGRFTYTAVEPRYAAFGWRVRVKRPVLEFSRLERARRRGFVLAGSGRATVTTAGLFRPRARYAVRLSGAFGPRNRILRATRAGRLRVRVPLGPANRVQQYRPTAATRVFRTRVRIAARRR
jgi:S-formylglutathione hydrolase FrmB